MKNRESLYPGRVKLTPVDAANGIYDLVRADEPQEEGTPLNKKLLDFAVAACGVTAGTATAYTLDDEFGGFELVDGAKVNFRLHVESGAGATLNVNGTGEKALKTIYGNPMPPGIGAGKWIEARYDVTDDAYICNCDSANVLSCTQLPSDASSVVIPVPEGFNVYRLTGIGNIKNNTITIKSNLSNLEQGSSYFKVNSAEPDFDYDTQDTTIGWGYSTTLNRVMFSGMIYRRAATGGWIIVLTLSGMHLNGALTMTTNPGNLTHITVNANYYSGASFLLEGIA